MIMSHFVKSEIGASADFFFFFGRRGRAEGL